MNTERGCEDGGRSSGAEWAIAVRGPGQGCSAQLSILPVTAAAAQIERLGPDVPAAIFGEDDARHWWLVRHLEEAI